MQRALICGFGALGESIAQQLLQKGMRVYAIQRSIKNFENVQMIHADIFSLSQLPNVDYLFYLIPPESKSVTSYKKAYIHGLKHILKLISTQPKPPKVILRSSIDIYNDCTQKYVNEETKIIARHQVTTILKQSENILNHSQYPHIILRLAPIKEHLLQTIISRMQERKISFSKRPNPLHWISLKAAANTAVQLLPHHGIFNISSAPTTFNTTLAWLSSRHGSVVKHPKHMQPYQSKPTVYLEKMHALGLNLMHPSPLGETSQHD